MSSSNRKLIEKADLAISDLTTSGGYLDTQFADKFIRLAIKESVLLSQISVTPMKGPKEERDKIRFSGRVLNRGSEGTALLQAQRAKPALSKFTLDVKEFKAEVHMNDSVMEDNIERGTFNDTVMQLLSAAVSRDIEYISIQSDTTSATDLLVAFDGFLKLVTSNTVAGGSVALAKSHFRDMLKTMPDEFAKVERLRYYTCRQARIDYRDSIADRATGLGDVYLTQSDKTIYNDMPIVAIPEWPNPSSVTQVLLTDPQNLTVGIHRQIRFEVDRDISAGVNIIVATIRFDVAVQEQLAAVKATAITTA